MSFDSETAAIRFGTGLGPGLATPQSSAQMLKRLSGPDEMARRFDIPVFMTLAPDIAKLAELQQKKRNERDKKRIDDLTGQIRKLRRSSQVARADYLKAGVARSLYTQDGFRERLVRFWADHFTVKGKNGVLRSAVSPYVEEAIRPNITAPFHQLLTAAVSHPMMLLFLDQAFSAGPGSRLAKRRKGRGLNENLAREVLELHTMGVGGGYTQSDVRQLAELFTGMSVSRKDGFIFRPGMSEPGAETVLGRSYGGRRPGMDDIRAFLGDLAVHPDTARNICRKLVVHFISDDPDAGLIDQMTRVFLDTKGDLPQVYRAMLDHPAAWVRPDRKIKQPFDFIVSALRALNMDAARLMALKPREALLYIASPMQLMGQTFEEPTGPDGWPEEASAWITPQGVAGRIQWAMTVPRAARPDLPDPRQFLVDALGERAGPALKFAANGAATKWEGIGLILSSPEFQRR